MKKKTRKKGLTIKMISTSATVLLLCSSILGPISVLAENTEANQTGQNEDIQESQVEANRLDMPQLDTKATKAGEKPYMGQHSFSYNNSDSIASLQNTAVTKGIYLTYNGKSYPFTTSLGSTFITWSKGGFINVNYSYTFEGQTYSGYRGISFDNTDYKPNPKPDPEEEFQIKISSNQKTIEYGTKFDPVKEFGGYVHKGDYVYGSIRTYEGSYKDGVKSGTYYGVLRYKNAPSTGVIFNLTAPVTVTVVRTQLDKATQNVNNLFKDNSHSEINEQVDQNSIDSVLDQVIALPDTPEKNALLVLLEKVQNLLNNQSIVEQAETNVDNLFSDDMHTTLAEGVTQADINAAKDVVNQVIDTAKKEELLNEIQKAQELLDSQNQAALDKAKATVDALFEDDTHTKLGENVTQEMIDQASALVNALPESEGKTQWLADIATAQKLLDEKLQEEAAALEKAKVTTNALFGDDTHTTLAEGVTQETIDNAKNMIDALGESDDKAQLLNDVQKAQELLDSQNQAALDKAKVAVDALFADASHTKLGENVTQEMIDQASALVNALPESEQKTQWLADIATAQKLLDEKLQEEEAAIEKAKNAVDALFKDKDHTILEDGIAQKNIDNAANLVNKLAEGELKEQLLKDLALADKLLNGETVITTNSFVIGKSKYVEGTISGNKITKIALEINGVLKKQILASKGNYKYWALDQIIDAKDKVFVVGYDSKGVQISKEQVEVVAASEEIGLDTNLFTIGKDNYVYGSYTGDVTKVALRIDGKLTQKISVKNGEIKYYAKDKVTNANLNVELVAFNAADQIVSFKTVKVTDTLATMSLNNYRIGEGYVTGTYTGDAKFMTLIINGVAKQTIGISNGQIKYYAKDKILSAADKVEVALLDGNKTEVQRASLLIATTLGSLQLNDYKLNTAYLEGSYTGDVVRIRVSVNGETKQTIPVSQELFKYYARNIIHSNTDNVVVEALDSANNVLDTKVVTITK
ncbi:toxin Cry1Ac domain D-VI-related protein [Carnobacterium sp. FSL E2-0243]|uniref:toxin Cry1Ac domain D-VI-related protein n=1 Tax=Carnobacterium sp. FSL E2-0243 TaxID=2921365 RepID=UPI0030F8FB54